MATASPTQRQTAGRNPLEVLCLVMVAAGFALVLSGFGGPFERWFGNWRGRGLAQFSAGIADPRMTGLFSTMEGILGASLVGKWLTAWALIRRADPLRHAWSRRALFGGLVALGLFDFGLLMLWQLPAVEALTELLVPVLIAVLLLRSPAEPTPGAPETTTGPDSAPSPHPPTLAWRSLEAFAWLNVALGCCLSVAVFSPAFSLYRDSMNELWFGAATPAQLEPWLRYGYGAIGAAFAGHFWLLASLARHAARQRWAWWTYAGTVFAWFCIDSIACAARGAWFNVAQVNLPALALTLVLLVWARASLAAPDPGE